MKYAGSNWLSRRGRELSPLGVDVADILGQAWQGLYHIESAVTHKRCKWNDERAIEVVVGQLLSTFDSGVLTILVFLCHEKAIRLEISGACQGYLRLRFSQRKHGAGSISERHPTMQGHLDSLIPLLDGIAENQGGEE